MSSNFISKAYKKLVESSTGSGILLFVCVVLSLVLANSPLSEALQNFFTKEIGYENETVELKYSIATWINDGLMAIFFLLVGLEIKKEIVDGQLSSPRQAALPIFAAI